MQVEFSYEGYRITIEQNGEAKFVKTELGRPIRRRVYEETRQRDMSRSPGAQARDRCPSRAWPGLVSVRTR